MANLNDAYEWLADINPVEIKQHLEDGTLEAWCDAYRCFLAARIRNELDRLNEVLCDVESLMWYSGEGCNICAWGKKDERAPYCKYECAQPDNLCVPLWRGCDACE